MHVPNMLLGREVIEEVAAFTRKLKASFASLVRERNMTLPRARVFFALSKKDGINQRELAELLDLETPTLVRILDAMEAQNFVERRTPDSDRRAKQIFMTEAGKAIASEVDELATEVRARVIEGISEQELRVALKVVRAMMANLTSVGKG
jgi:MarR family transcriptional regulator, transcriptional regulator for hemolysin